MKKLTALLMSLLLIFTVAGCSSSASGGDPGAHAEPQVRTLADDTTLRALVVTVPEQFEKVERFVESTVDGKIIEKDLNYTISDDLTIGYALMCDISLVDALGASNLETMEKLDVDGRDVYIYHSGNDHLAFLESGSDIYAIDYNTSDENTDGFYEAAKALKFNEENPNDLLLNDDDLYDIVYTLDPAYNLYGSSISYSENMEGDPLQKTVVWKFGESDENMDFRLMIRVYKNSTMEDVLNAEKNYEEKTIGDITYTVLVNDEGAPYEYYTQHNDDVYEIRNNGKSGWFTTRSDESFTALDSLLSSISFK